MAKFIVCVPQVSVSTITVDADRVEVTDAHILRFTHGNDVVAEFGMWVYWKREGA